jgi:hypothetical protein
VAPSPPGPGAYTIHIDAKGLEWSVADGTTPRRTAVILLVATFDKKGKELTQVAKEFKASAPPTVAPNGRLDRAIDITTKVDADPKAVRARFVVRVSSTGRIGTADATLGGGAP